MAGVLTPRVAVAKFPGNYGVITKFKRLAGVLTPRVAVARRESGLNLSQRIYR